MVADGRTQQRTAGCAAYRDHSYRDSACGASVLGWVGSDGALQRLEAICGAPKVEGIAMEGTGRLLMVTDSDDPARPSQLLTVELP